MTNNGTHKRKETYATEVLEIARLETNIYDDFSTDYEIDPDTGQINVPTRDKDVKLSDYDILNGIELTQSATDYLPLPIDQDYGCNELCDGYEANAVPDNIRAQRIDSAGYAIGLKKEKMAIEALKKGNENEDTEALTESNVYKKIAADVINMKKRGMKLSNMRVVISADTELLLLTDEKYSNTASTIGAELIREGITGKIAGAPTKPNYLLDDDIEYIIYDKRYIQKYEVWKKEPAFEDLKDGKHIGASALQGRQVGGLMVTNKLGVQIKKKSSVVVDPEITSITVTPEEGLTDPVEQDAKVASLSCEGGTPAYTYSLAGGTDDEKFKIEGTEVKANQQLTQNTYTIKVKVTDSKSKEKTSDDVTITVSEAI